MCEPPASAARAAPLWPEHGAQHVSGFAPRRESYARVPATRVAFGATRIGRDRRKAPTATKNRQGDGGPKDAGEPEFELLLSCAWAADPAMRPANDPCQNPLNRQLRSKSLPRRARPKWRRPSAGGSPEVPFPRPFLRSHVPQKRVPRDILVRNCGRYKHRRPRACDGTRSFVLNIAERCQRRGPTARWSAVP